MKFFRRVNYLGLLVFSFIAMTTFTVFAIAPDFTFNIPVQLSSLTPTAVEGSILCAVYSSEERTPATRIGRGSTRFTITDGAYDGEVTVTIDAEDGKNNTEATHYRCSFFLFKENDPRSFVPSENSPVRWLRARGNTLIKVREGEIR